MGLRDDKGVIKDGGNEALLDISFHRERSMQHCGWSYWWECFITEGWFILPISLGVKFKRDQ
jgi:hypothetical protein